MRETFELPLLGVKVIDFGQYIAGPAVGMMLGDLGATVVHIHPPSGPKKVAQSSQCGIESQ